MNFRGGKRRKGERKREHVDAKRGGKKGGEGAIRSVRLIPAAVNPVWKEKRGGEGEFRVGEGEKRRQGEIVIYRSAKKGREKKKERKKIEDFGIRKMEGGKGGGRTFVSSNKTAKTTSERKRIEKKREKANFGRGSEKRGGEGEQFSVRSPFLISLRDMIIKKEEKGP